MDNQDRWRDARAPLKWAAVAIQNAANCTSRDAFDDAMAEALEHIKTSQMILEMTTEATEIDNKAA